MLAGLGNIPFLLKSMHTHSKRIQQHRGTERDSSAPSPAPLYRQQLPVAACHLSRGCVVSLPPLHVCAMCWGCPRPTQISRADPGTVRADGGGWSVSTPLARVPPQDRERVRLLPLCPSQACLEEKVPTRGAARWKGPHLSDGDRYLPTCPAQGANPSPHHNAQQHPLRCALGRAGGGRSFRPLSPVGDQCCLGFCFIGFQTESLAGRLRQLECRPDGTTVGSGPIGARPRGTP